MKTKAIEKLEETVCYHCGSEIKTSYNLNAHSFCCEGCLRVYELLSSHELSCYYSIENTPGVTQQNQVIESTFAYLDNIKIQNQLLLFNDKKNAKVIFQIPNMHCSSCIWLLENLNKIESNVLQARVLFLRKELHITFNIQEISLRQIAELLHRIGYSPALNLQDIDKKPATTKSNKLIYQIGIAGFCFGNIMLISFPEYFGLDSLTHSAFSKVFGYINFGLSLPVFFYCAQDYFIATFNGFRKKIINIDMPLALGIFIMFFRSTYEVFTGSGIGWFDTHAGLVFLLLVGKWFQQRTFDTLSFDRDYKSYFPVASTVIRGENEISVPVNELEIGDRIRINNNELIPADAILLKGQANIDFSFVTGESEPIKKVLGEIIYAGGKQQGTAIELEICKKVSQSYLTQLWNNEAFQKDDQSIIESFQQVVSKYFTIVLILLALVSAVWSWFTHGSDQAMNVFTSVLIIACPCALALSSPFALGTAMRILSRNKFYIKSTHVIEKMAHVNTLVYDKTGTITKPESSKMNFFGQDLSICQMQKIASLVSHSTHPLSKEIYKYFSCKPNLEVQNYAEVAGKGISGKVLNNYVKVGSKEFVCNHSANTDKHLSTQVYLSIDDKVLGYFEFEQNYRKGLYEVIEEFKLDNYQQYLLSGDNQSAKKYLLNFFKSEEQLYFNQSPIDKLRFIQELIHENKKVAMIGDGLNDAGALKAAQIGISVTENTTQFSPASDVIMDASKFNELNTFFKFSKATLQVIHVSFFISLIYNLVGLSFAVQGALSPLFAAVLMPVSSITIILFTTTFTTLSAKKLKLK